MTTLRVALPALTLLLWPFAAADFPGSPSSVCDGSGVDASGRPRDHHVSSRSSAGAQTSVGWAGSWGAVPIDGCMGGDGEPEYGVGGAFLSATHHDPVGDGYWVTPIFGDGWVFGSDGNGDGLVQESDPADCYETLVAGGPHWSSCPAGADGGWWFFAACIMYPVPPSGSCLQEAHVA